jgi:AcrR family transcriptional regulator
MTNITGKQRQLRERDRLFVRAAWELLLSEGYENFSLERVAELTGWSSRTVYLRFGSKLGLLAPVGLECRKLLSSMGSKAAAMPGRPRERLLALGEGFVHYARNYPDNFRVLRIVESQATLAPEGNEVLARFAEYDNETFRLMLDIVQAGVAAGDLVLQEGDTVESVCFGFWTLMGGAFDVLTGRTTLREVHLSDPVEKMLRNGHRLADGFGWRPLFKEWDYAATSARVRAALDAAKTETVKGNGGETFSSPNFIGDLSV